MSGCRPVADALLSSPFSSNQQHYPQAPWVSFTRLKPSSLSLLVRSMFRRGLRPRTGPNQGYDGDVSKHDISSRPPTMYSFVATPLAVLVPSSGPSANDCHRTASARTRYTAPQKDPAIWYCRCAAHHRLINYHRDMALGPKRLKILLYCHRPSIITY